MSFKVEYGRRYKHKIKQILKYFKWLSKYDRWNTRFESFESGNINKLVEKFV